MWPLISAINLSLLNIHVIECDSTFSCLYGKHGHRLTEKLKDLSVFETTVVVMFTKPTVEGSRITVSCMKEGVNFTRQEEELTLGR